MEKQNLIEQENNISPLISIWYKPRKTIRKIISTHPTHLVIVFAVLAGIGQAINRAVQKSPGDAFSLWELIGMCIIGGSIGGIFYLYIAGGLFRWTGSWFGGQASSEDVRAAIAWSTVPATVSNFLWIPLIIVYGHEMFTIYTISVYTNPRLSFFIIVVGLIQYWLTIWSLILYVICISEVHQISGWKTIGSLLSGGLVLVLPVSLIVYLSQVITFGPLTKSHANPRLT